MILRWIRRRRVIESRKLVIQSFLASTDAAMPFSCMLNGGFNSRKIYRECADKVYQLAIKVDELGFLRGRDLENIIEINRDLRKFFDDYGGKVRGKFDEIYRPIGGWDYYLDENAKDIPFLDRCVEAMGMHFDEISH